MSKSLGNVVDPLDYVEKYGVDALRYFLLREIPTQDDGDFTAQRFHEVYTAELANSLGNTASRVAKLCATKGFVQDAVSNAPILLDPEYVRLLTEAYDIRSAVQLVMDALAGLEHTIAFEKVWTLEGAEAQAKLAEYVHILRWVAEHLLPIIPTTAATLRDVFSAESIPAMTPLFPRVQL